MEAEKHHMDLFVLLVNLKFIFGDTTFLINCIYKVKMKIGEWGGLLPLSTSLPNLKVYKINN